MVIMVELVKLLVYYVVDLKVRGEKYIKEVVMVKYNVLCIVREVINLVF